MLLSMELPMALQYLQVNEKGEEVDRTKPEPGEEIQIFGVRGTCICTDPEDKDRYFVDMWGFVDIEKAEVKRQLLGHIARLFHAKRITALKLVEKSSGDMLIDQLTSNSI